MANREFPVPYLNTSTVSVYNATGTLSLTLDGNGITTGNAAGPLLSNVATTFQIPTLIPDRSDSDTGVGKAVSDGLCLISGGVEAVRYTEASSGILVKHSANSGLTADVGSSQGDGVITSSYNVYSTVANAGDAATLPAAFQAGTLVYVKNDGANSMDVFPASGDDAGAGANVAIAVASGNFAVFIATTANATWTKLMGGTA